MFFEITIPSLREKSKPYDMWALIEKDSEIPGENVKSAYCSCVAGLVGTYSYVVLMLIHIEHAVRFKGPYIKDVVGRPEDFFGGHEIF